MWYEQTFELTSKPNLQDFEQTMHCRDTYVTFESQDMRLVPELFAGIDSALSSRLENKASVHTCWQRSTRANACKAVFCEVEYLLSCYTRLGVTASFHMRL